MLMSFALLLLTAADLIACDPGPLVLVWGGRVVPGLSAPLLVDDGKPGAGLSSLLPVDNGRAVDKPWTSPSDRHWT